MCGMRKLRENLPSRVYHLISRVYPLAVSAAVFAAFAVRAAAVTDLAEEARDEMRRTVRPGGVGGRPFWNVNCTYFMYPPAFGFAEIPGAKQYAFTVIDDLHRVFSFRAERPTASLEPVWERLATNGFATVRCAALDAEGREIKEVGLRRLFKKRAFEPGSYPPAARGYAEAARRICRFLEGSTAVKNFVRAGNPPRSYALYCYPAKIVSSLIQMEAYRAKALPSERAEAIRNARVFADWLIGQSAGPDAAWPHCPPTYSAGRADSDDVMTIYPASAGLAYLKLAAAGGGEKYRAAAVAIGETYLRHQGADGTWPLKVNAKTGKLLTENRLVPSAVTEFLDALAGATGEAKWRTAASRAFAYVERTLLASWNWEGQFEDTAPSRPYENITKHDACWTAIQLVARYPGDAAKIAEARELLRFAEDQFVFWDLPGRRDGAAPIARGLFLEDFAQESWTVPSVIEQWPGCAWPIDSSVTKLIRTYLALYRAEGRPLDLAKARALGDSMTRVQEPTGRIATFWVQPKVIPGDPMGPGGRYPYNGWVDWINCMISDIFALEELAAEAGGTHR